MKPAPFVRHVPRTLDEALKILAQVAPQDGRVLAGGQSLVPIMAFRLAKPAHLVDINEVAGLDKIASDGKVLSIGACVRHAAFHKPVVDNPLGKLLCYVARHIAHYPIRMRGTFCGSLAHADPASEWCLVAATLDATMVAKSTRGERLIAAKDYFQGIMSTALAEDELLAEVRLPLLAADAKFGFNEFNRRAGDFAMAAALVTYRLPTARSSSRASASAAPSRVRAASKKPKPRSTARRRATPCSAPPPRPPLKQSIRWRIIRPAAITGATWCARWCAARWSTAHEPAVISPLSSAQGRVSPPPTRPCAWRGGKGMRRMTAHTKGTGMKWVGRAIRRLEDPALVTGQGRFTADLAAAHWVRFVRSPVAAGKITKIDAPNDAMVVTAADLKGVKKITPMLHKFNYKPVGQPVLADGQVRFVGEPVAAVVAASEEEAEDIADLVELSIERNHAGGRCARVRLQPARRRCTPRRPATSSSKANSRRPSSTRSGTARPRSSRSRRARAGRTPRRWRRAPATPPMTPAPAASR